MRMYVYRFGSEEKMAAIRGSLDGVERTKKGLSHVMTAIIERYKK